MSSAASLTGGTPITTGVDDDTAERLAMALRCATVSHDTADDTLTIHTEAEFERLATHLEESFPRVHAELTWQRFGHSRLYQWRGSEPDSVAAILLAHLDVVPVDDHGDWAHPPFAGVVDKDFIWGRGAIDDKSRVLALLEAVEAALAAGRRPRRSIYLAFGHDEEALGSGGAARMAAELRERGVHADLLLDEGGVITTELADGTTTPVATVMVGEKGWATVRLQVHEDGGHSSMPGRRTAIGRLARAVARLQDHPMPLRIIPIIGDMLNRVRPAMSQPRRAALSLLPAAAPLVARLLAGAPQTEALVRTTAAPTVIHGGVKANVLPQRAEALVNFRILPGDSVATVLDHCRRTIADPQVRIDLLGPTSEPSAVTAPGPGFAMIAELTQAVVPGVAVTTGLVPGATDSRHYDGLATTRANFAPVVFNAADLRRIHGSDERLSRLNYARLIDFDSRLLDRLM